MRVLMTALIDQQDAGAQNSRRRYHRGEEYDVPDAVGAGWIRRGWAAAVITRGETRALAGAAERKRGRA